MNLPMQEEKTPAEQAEKYWPLVEERLQDAVSITFDGCHKIYLQMDAKQHEKVTGYGYEPILVRKSPKRGDANCVTPETALGILKDWLNQSCGLEFIQAVSSVDEGTNPNMGFECLIPQCYYHDEEE